jgi:hypothetical protein
MSDYSQSELTGLSPKFFKTNRDNFIKNLKLKLETLPEGSFLFLKGGSNKPRYDNDDDFHYFVQESNFSEHLSMLLIIFTILFLCSIIILIRHKTNLINIHNKKERKIFDKKKENDKKQVQI